MDLQLQCKFLLDLMAGMLGCGYINSGLLRSSALSEAIESKYGHREKPPSTKKKNAVRLPVTSQITVGNAPSSNKEKEDLDGASSEVKVPNAPK
jgi:hypothetical protein